MFRFQKNFARNEFLFSIQIDLKFYKRILLNSKLASITVQLFQNFHLNASVNSKKIADKMKFRKILLVSFPVINVIEDYRIASESNEKLGNFVKILIKVAKKLKY